ncbi:MAG: methyltransferase domain-containing protein [Candidatus Bathyarchaeia archaeon]
MQERADIIFYSTALHDFKDPAEVLSNAKQMLKHGGKLVNVYWKKKPTVFSPPVRYGLAKSKPQA